MKCKIIQNHSTIDLQRRVNEFFDQNPDIIVSNVVQSESSSSSTVSSYVTMSIFYKERQDIRDEKLDQIL